MTLYAGDEAGEEAHSLSLVSGLGDTGGAIHWDGQREKQVQGRGKDGDDT